VNAAAPAALVLLAFLAGSIPCGTILARVHGGVDLRSQGSGNPGATNALRVMGPAWGIATLLLDVGKGWLAAGPLSTWLGLGPTGGDGTAAAAFAGAAGAPAPASPAHVWPLAAGLAAVCGHVFSPWLRFRGGKGVATAVGAFLAIAPLAAAVAIAVFAAIAGFSRIVSLASLGMVVAFPLAVLFLGSRPAAGTTAVWGALLAVLIAWRHRPNLARLAQGSEHRWGRKR